MKKLILVFLVSFLFWSCAKTEKDSGEASRSQTSNTEVTTQTKSLEKIAKPKSDGTLGTIPDYEFETLNGEKLNISDYRGKVLMINFWATWCGPCRKEIPELVKLKEKYGSEGLEIIGIALDEEGFEVVEPFLNQFDINYTIVMDDYSYGNQLGGIYMVPTTYLVKTDGKIAFRKIGEITVENIEEKITELL